MRGFNVLWAMLSLWLVGSLAQAAPISARLLELLGCDAGVALMHDTQAGHELAIRILGRDFTGAADVADLNRKIFALPAGDDLRGELQSRLERAEDEFDSKLRARPMSLGDRSLLLEELSSRYLKFQLLGGGKIEFLPIDAGGGGYAGAREAMEGLRLAPTSLGATLETAIPVEPGSMVSRLGAKVYDELIGIESRFMVRDGLESADEIAQGVRASRGGGNSAVTLKDMLDYVVAERQRMAGELRSLEARYRTADPLLSETLGKAAHEVDLSPAALEKVAEKAPVLAALTFGQGEHGDQILDYVSKLRGEMGELKVAVRVKDLVARGLKVEELGAFFGKGNVADLARARLAELSPQYPREFGKELDLIMDQGTLWGEVKNYGGVLSPQHRNFEKVLEQAQLTVEIRKILESDPVIDRALKAMGKHIRFRIYLLGGVTESAARALEDLGYEVSGPRYLDGAAGAASAQIILPAAAEERVAGRTAA